MYIYKNIRKYPGGLIKNIYGYPVGDQKKICGYPGGSMTQKSDILNRGIWKSPFRLSFYDFVFLVQFSLFFPFSRITNSIKDILQSIYSRPST